MPSTVFLDIDGVISDSEALAADFESLLGEVLAPALGRTPEEWGRANTATYPSISEQHVRSGRSWDDPIANFDKECGLSVIAMCEWLGVGAPSDDEARHLGYAYHQHVRRNGNAAFPDAAAAIRELAADHELHLATGNVSWNAIAVMERLGTERLIGFPCGVDLIGVIKGLPIYYERLFEAVDVRPQDAIVVDDSPAQLSHAASLGASTILVSHEPVTDLSVATAVVRGVGEVPATVAIIDSPR